MNIISCDYNQINHAHQVTESCYVMFNLILTYGYGKQLHPCTRFWLVVLLTVRFLPPKTIAAFVFNNNLLYTQCIICALHMHAWAFNYLQSYEWSKQR